MRNLVDQIEFYLKKRIEEETGGSIELQRRQLAEAFNCVPSQINYVLKTRFSLQSGYIVESQRGGGGYIRITKINFDSKKDLLEEVYSNLGEKISQRQAYQLLQRLEEEEYLTSREADLLRTMMHRRVLGVKLPLRDLLRARLLKGIFRILLKEES